MKEGDAGKQRERPILGPDRVTLRERKNNAWREKGEYFERERACSERERATLAET